MISRVRSFLEKHFGPPGDDPGQEEARLRVAVAALLVEVLRADFEVSRAERRQVLESLRELLALDSADAEEILAAAEGEIDDSHDLYQFTSQINRAFDHQRKLRLMEQLWRVAQSDEVVHKYEEHIIRRVAGLLHVSHGEFIATKLRLES